MTDITDEQRAAVEYLRSNAGHLVHATVLLRMLPPDLTDPQPVLPTEPGWYLGHDAVTGRDIPVELDDSIFWFNHSGATPHRLGNPERFYPFRRLVVERPQITREQIKAAYESRSTYGGGLDAILALVNGSDRD